MKNQTSAKQIYYPGLEGKMRICNGTPAGVAALAASLKRNEAKNK